MKPDSLTAKLTKVSRRLASLKGVAIAFSGGVDSALLLYLAAQALPGRVLALTVNSPLSSPADLEAAPRVVENLRRLGLEFSHQILMVDILANPKVRLNTVDRCYWCKKELTRLWFAEAGRLDLPWVLEGSQADDEHLHRPGSRALKEAGVLSPLAEAGLTKSEIRTALAGFDVWGADRPSQACLASRVPYGRKLTRPLLERIGQTENLLFSWSLTGALRARAHGDLLRLETEPEHWPTLLSTEFWPERLQKLRQLGWRFITLDLAGFNSGSFDRKI